MKTTNILKILERTNTKKMMTLHITIDTIERLNKFKDNQLIKGTKKIKNSDLVEELLINFLNEVEGV